MSFEPILWGPKDPRDEDWYSVNWRTVLERDNAGAPTNDNITAVDWTFSGTIEEVPGSRVTEGWVTWIKIKGGSDGDTATCKITTSNGRELWAVANLMVAHRGAAA